MEPAGFKHVWSNGRGHSLHGRKRPPDTSGLRYRASPARYAGSPEPLLWFAPPRTCRESRVGCCSHRPENGCERRVSTLDSLILFPLNHPARTHCSTLPRRHWFHFLCSGIQANLVASQTSQSRRTTAERLTVCYHLLHRQKKVCCRVITSTPSVRA